MHRELTQQTLLQYTSAILSGDVPALGPASEDDPKGTELEKIDGVYKIVGKNFNPMVLSDDRLCVLSTACVWHCTHSQARHALRMLRGLKSRALRLFSTASWRRSSAAC